MWIAGDGFVRAGAYRPIKTPPISNCPISAPVACAPAPTAGRRASETGETDRKGQPMSKAGSRLLRTTFVRAANTARKQDPQLARIYFDQVAGRGKGHIEALCVVAATLAERAWVVMERGMPYVVGA